MTIENQVLALISKLMKENLREESEITRCYQKLDDFFNGDFVKCLDLGFYNDNATLISETRQELVQIRFWDSIPMLYAKQYINVFSALEDMRQYIDSIVELEDWFFRNDSIPVVFVHSDVEDISISAVTYDEKLVEISKDEYGLICNEFDNYNIEKKKLVRFFIVGINNWNEKNCLCVWQEKAFEEEDIIPCFQKNNCMNVLFGRNIPHINRRLLSVKQTKLCILSSAEVLAQLTESSLEKNNGQVGELLSEDRFIALLCGETESDANRSELNKLRVLLFKVEAFYNHEIRKIQLIKKEMHEDLLHLSEGKIKESISEFLREQQSKERLFNDKLIEYQRISGELIKLVREYGVLRDREYLGVNREYDYQYDSYLEELYIELARNGEYKRAQECLRCMRDAKLAEVEVFEAYFKYLQGDELDYDDKTIITNSSNKSEPIARTKVLLSDELDYTEEQLMDIVDNICEPKSGKEFFWFAKHALRDSRYEIAADFMKKAFENDEKQAATSLVEMSCNYGVPSLCELARMMIPEANFQLGIDQLDNNLDEALVNLKIASAKKHIYAIEFIAELLFEVVKELSLSEMEDVCNKENVINIISMYEFLLQNEYKKEYQLRIGLMYCKLQDYRRALEHLEQLDEAEAMYECALIYENGLGVAVNIKKARDFYRKCGNYKDASVQFIKINEIIMQEKRDNQESRNNYREKREVVSVERSGFCFITTAACIVLKKDKDCNELNILRHFRDSYISDGGKGDLLISEYYRIGPEIVKKIDREWNPFALYMQLWCCYIYPSCKCIAESNFEEAKMIYVDMVKRLCIKYQIKVDERICKEYDIGYV